MQSYDNFSNATILKHIDYTYAKIDGHKVIQRKIDELTEKITKTVTSHNEL